MRSTSQPTLSAVLVIVFGGLVAGCSDSSKGAVLSTGGGATTPASGPLTRKAAEFELSMQAKHVPFGLVQDVREVSPGQFEGLGNSQSRPLWTGIYAASQAMAYRTTQDPDALARLEKALWALHDLHESSGTPGVITRGWDHPHVEPQGFSGSGRFAAYNLHWKKPSRDQYSGWFYGIAQGFPHVQDPALRAALQADVAAVCDRLLAGDLEMRAPWGPAGQVEVFFNLNPSYAYQNQITPQSWATIDDFPFNLITQNVPYSPALASALSNVNLPPIRAGEALRALFFFSVGAEVTGDPRYAAYKNQLLHQRNFADVVHKYGTFVDDVLHGRNLQVVEDTLRQLFGAAASVLQAYLIAQGQSSIIPQVLIPMLSGTLSHWAASIVVDVIAWIQDPSNASKLQRVMQFGQLLSTVLGVVGQQSLANQINGFIVSYGQHLNGQGLIDAADTVRSHLGVAMTLLPLSKLIEWETDPLVVARYRSLLDRQHGYLAADRNPVVNLVHLGWGAAPTANDLPHALDQLHLWPTDMSLSEVDNGNWPGLVRSPWPDRFGRVGNHALVPHHFPVDQRARHIFLWNEHPREIKQGTNDPDVKVAPLGYLFPYWMARELRVVGPGD